MQHRWSLGSEEIPNFRAPHHHHHHMAVFGRKDGIGISVEASNMVAPRSKERERERVKNVYNSPSCSRACVSFDGSGPGFYSPRILCSCSKECILPYKRI